MSWSARRRARYRRYALRLVAVVAFGGTAALAVVLTRVPEQATLTAENLACTTQELMASVGSAGAGVPRRAATYTLEFVNVSHRTCVLDGYPSVDAYDGARQIGSPATEDPSVRPRTVTLAPGEIAHATLRYTGTDRFGPAACHQVTAYWLHVYPPLPLRAAGRAMIVPWRIPACSRRGPQFMSVAAIQPRSGMVESPQY
jgi:hypothetical protein